MCVSLNCTWYLKWSIKCCINDLKELDYAAGKGLICASKGKKGVIRLYRFCTLGLLIRRVVSAH